MTYTVEEGIPKPNKAARISLPLAEMNPGEIDAACDLIREELAP